MKESIVTSICAVVFYLVGCGNAAMAGSGQGRQDVSMKPGSTDGLQALFDRAAASGSKTVSLERGRVYCVAKTLKLDERHSGLIIEGNGAVIDFGRKVAGWRREGAMLVADIPDWDGDILSLWVNGRRAQLARTPNGEGARLDSEVVRKPLMRPYEGDPAKDGVRVDASAIRGVLESSEEERREAFVDYIIAWFTPRCRLVDVYENGDGTANIFARNLPCLHGTQRKSMRYVPFNMGPNEKSWAGVAGVAVLNLKRLLDAPGEFFWDKKGRRLSYIPRTGEDPATLDASFALGERVLDIAGTSPSRSVENVTVRNVTFRHGRQDRNSPEGFAPASQSAASCLGFVNVANARNLTLIGIRVEHCDVYGINFWKGVWDSSIIESTLFDCGSGGVRVGVDYTPVKDGDDRNDPLQNGFVTIRGNRIHGYGRWNASGCGVILFDVGHCSVEDNEIWDGYYTGVSVGWTWNAPRAHTQGNRIIGNRIHDLGLGVIDDFAGVYALGGESEGSVIAKNDIRNMHRFNYGAWGVYLDSKAGWYLVESNVCDACDDGGFFKNQGIRNHVRRNRFLNSKYTQLGDDPNEDNDIVFEENEIVYSLPAEVFRRHVPDYRRGIWRNNVYRCLNGKVRFGPEKLPLAELQRRGGEIGSKAFDK
ncbi:MAG: right-handed parallel beta-helix repeat-containing protein [bacterium]|nr:right-handed parallel beta-helix repeat-containing protein [Candidatus Colisoma equi]